MDTTKKVVFVLPPENIYNVQTVFDEAYPGWKERGRLLIGKEALVVVVSLPQTDTAQPEQETLADLQQRSILSFFAFASVSSNAGFFAAEETGAEKLSPACQVFFAINLQSCGFALLISADREDMANLVAEYIQSLLHRGTYPLFGVTDDWYEVHGI